MRAWLFSFVAFFAQQLEFLPERMLFSFSGTCALGQSGPPTSAVVKFTPMQGLNSSTRAAKWRAGKLRTRRLSPFVSLQSANGFGGCCMAPVSQVVFYYKRGLRNQKQPFVLRRVFSKEIKERTKAKETSVALGFVSFGARTSDAF